MFSNGQLLPTALSIVVVILGVGGAIRGWQMKYRNRPDLICDWDDKPLPNPDEFAGAFARVYFTIGGLLIAMPLLLVAGMNFLIWGAIAATVVWYWFFAIDSISNRARAAEAGRPLSQVPPGQSPAGNANTGESSRQ